MSDDDVELALRELARDAGLEVRELRGAGAEGEPSATSALCRVKGETWVVLSRQDPAKTRAAVLAQALRQECGDFLADRFLAPALRGWLEEGGPETGF